MKFLGFLTGIKIQHGAQRGARIEVGINVQG